ncbi:MAG: hypothetical protein J1E98_04070, partial [Lachnospiraceae bacterium]|nr:hypothetical protein [Lachnospiraceae bacterium]
MQNSKRGGKHLLKKEHIKKEALCRWLFLLHGICIMIFIFGGLVPFPAIAQEVEQTEPKEEASNNHDLYIPGTMFLFSGLNTENYGQDYTSPPIDWRGVEIKDNMQTSVIVPGINKDEHTISGDVDQKLFPQYNGYYVRRVTVRDNDVTVLGITKLQEHNSYVYYYINNEKQSTEVSVTTLPEGQKFIIQYCLNDYSIEFQVKMNDLSGDDVTRQWVNNIFGTDRPVKTNLGAYAFNAQAPDGYTLSFYLAKKNSDGG